MLRLIACILLGTSLGAQSLPTITRVTQNGNNSAPVSPGTFAYVYGTAITTQPKVAVNGVNAAIFGSLDTVAFFQIPPSTPVGQASVVVTTTAGSSAPFPIVLVATSPSVISCACPQGGTNYFRNGSGDALYFPTPGDVVEIGMVGLGAATPLPLPKLLIDGNEFPMLGTGTRGWSNGTTHAPWTSPSVIFKIPDLQPGRHTVVVQAGTATSPPINLDLIYSGIITSQSGLTFNTVQGGPAPLPQSFSVLSGVGTINFNLTTSTLSGGPQWLSVSPQGGSVQAGQLGLPFKVSIDPTGLAAGAYYGTIQVSADGVLNSPQSVTVVLKVAPTGTLVGPYLDSAGLIFLGTQSGGDPPPQSVTIFNPTAGSLSYTSKFAFAPTPNPFSYGPFSATIASGQSASLTPQATLKGLSPGLYTARIALTFSDQSTRNIDLLLAVASNGSAKPLAPLDAAGCTPTKIQPVFSQPGAGFNVPAAWPTPIVVTVVDDCANPLTAGSVYASFSNGDPRLPMYSLRNGSWAATWSGVKPGATVTVSATATDPVTGLSGTASITGGLGANPDVPIVSKGGVVDAASGGPALSPGSLINVYGSKLSTATGAAAGLPWASVLNNTTLLLGGKALPLYFTSDGQVVGMIPYDVALNTSLQLVARSGNALSSPQPALIIPVRPGVFVQDAATALGAIVRSDGAVAGPSAPAKPGEVVVVYCTGLGAVNPPVQAGVAASLTTLSSTVNAVTASVGGMPATVLFAGVTPGSSGLYQVNLVVPAGLADNDTTALVLSAGGQDSAMVTFAVRTPK
jgi:uncharacterized protein (TIGR03437 family)